MLQENSRTEFKSELNDKLEKEVVAFLNNKEGGILYIGLDDIGSPIGVPELDSTQLKIADRIKNNILPSTMGLFDIVTEEIDNIPIIKILISSGLEKPYYIKKQGMSPSWPCAKSVMPTNASLPSTLTHSWSLEYLSLAGMFIAEKFDG